MHSIRDDLVYTWRQLRRRPGFTALAVLALGVGIGATVTVFSIIHTVLLEPLPFPEAERLVRLREVSPQGSSFSVSEANYLDFRQRSRSFSELAAVRPTFLTLLGEGEEEAPGSGLAGAGASDVPTPERLFTLEATSGLLPALGVAPVLGRSFSPEESRPGAEAPVVLICHGLWQRRFGGDPEIVGRTLRFDGSLRTVVGVLPPGFDFFNDADLWIPLAPDPAYPRGDHRIEVFGRLAPGVSLEAAREEVAAVAAQLGREYPESNADWGVQLTSFPEWLIGPQVTRVNLVLLGAVTLLLLLACANVSNLLLAQATVRQQEMGVRMALGAGRRRLVRQLLTESAVLGLAGAGAGLLLAFWLVPAIQSLEFEALPRLDEVAVDGPVLAGAVAVTLLATFLFGLAPALQASRRGLARAVGQSHRTAADGSRGLREALVVLEVALAMVLLLGSGLLLRSFLRMLEIDPGFSPRGVLAVNVALPQERYPELSPQVGEFYRQALERIEALPGVTAAGATMVSPFSGLRPANFVAAADAPLTPENVVQIQWRSVTPGYFRAGSVPLLAGRLFDASDRLTPEDLEDGPSSLSAVISGSLARRLWGREPAVGRELLWGGEADGMRLRVVGVVGDVQDVDLTAPPQPLLFLSHDQIPWPQMTLFVKTEGDPLEIAGSLRHAIHEVDPRLALPGVYPLAESFAGAVAGPRFSALVLGLFAAAALLVASIGLYAVIAFSVARRRREIAIRMALGATTKRLMGMVLRRSMLLTAVGIGLGGGAALAAGRLLEGLLYDIPPTHAATYLGVALILAAAAFAASLLPARRVTRVDPAQATAAE